MEATSLGRSRTDKDRCRRYLPLAFSFDTRALILEINTSEFESKIAAQWEDNKRHVREELIIEFGVASYERMISDFTALGPAPWSIIARHNTFLKHMRGSFIWGAYYAALVAAGALGERLLNQLIVTLKGDYRDHAASVRIKGKASIQNWKLAVGVLHDWGVISADTSKDFLRLNMLRNKAVHYEPGLDESDAREDALAAARIVTRIVEAIFNPLGNGPPLFIAGVAGQSFIALEREADPFVKHFMIPASVLVSPNYEVQPTADQQFAVFDDVNYQDEFSELTDEEFAYHLNGPRRSKA